VTIYDEMTMRERLSRVFYKLHDQARALIERERRMDIPTVKNNASGELHPAMPDSLLKATFDMVDQAINRKVSKLWEELQERTQENKQDAIALAKHRHMKIEELVSALESRVSAMEKAIPQNTVSQKDADAPASQTDASGELKPAAPDWLSRSTSGPDWLSRETSGMVLQEVNRHIWILRKSLDKTNELLENVQNESASAKHSHMNLQRTVSQLESRVSDLEAARPKNDVSQKGADAPASQTDFAKRGELLWVRMADNLTGQALNTVFGHMSDAIKCNSALGALRAIQYISEILVSNGIEIPT